MTKKKESNAPLVAYKGFDKNLKCRDFQFEVGKDYEHVGGISICSSGFHACEYPLDVLSYYSLMDDNRFAIVEASGEIQKKSGGNEDSKICASHLRVKAEISIPALITASVDWHFNGWFKKAKKDGIKAASKDGSNLAASGYGSNLAASGYGSKLAASGNDSKLAASGNGSKLAASGEGSNVIVSAGNNVVAKGSDGTLICLTLYDEVGKPVQFVTGKVGEDGIKPDVWYRPDASGKLVEASL